MKLRFISLAMAAASLWVWAEDAVQVTLLMRAGTPVEKHVEADEQFYFDPDNTCLSFTSGSNFKLSDSASISMAYLPTDNGGDVLPSDEADVVYVEWNGTSAPQIRCSSAAVTINVDGQNVTLTNANVLAEMTYVLSGTAEAANSS